MVDFHAGPRGAAGEARARDDCPAAGVAERDGGAGDQNLAAVQGDADGAREREADGRVTPEIVIVAHLRLVEALVVARIEGRPEVA